jgi:hypothetical protein
MQARVRRFPDVQLFQTTLSCASFLFKPKLLISSSTHSSHPFLPLHALLANKWWPYSFRLSTRQLLELCRISCSVVYLEVETSNFSNSRNVFMILGNLPVIRDKASKQTAAIFPSLDSPTSRTLSHQLFYGLLGG